MHTSVEVVAGPSFISKDPAVAATLRGAAGAPSFSLSNDEKTAYFHGASSTISPLASSPQLHAFDVSPDGGALGVAGGSDGELVVFNTADGTVRRQLVG